MATPADQRLLELLDKWLQSLALHTKYSSLDDDSYWKIQPWVEHQRPSRWILDLAKQKTLALKAQVEERMAAGDTKFGDAMELMIFLANLVGSEHIERFIPVAEPGNERPLSPQEPPAAPAPADSVTGTREMPKFLATKQRSPTPAATPQVARNERKAAPKPAAKAAAKGKPKHDDPRDQVIADAVRLVQWGRKWFELPELIARMADRPSLPDVRRILKENKAAIDKQTGNR